MAMKSSLDIPYPYCALFQHLKCFNAVQSAFFDEVLNSDKSVVISAPTGSGKTVAFELAFLRLILQRDQSEPLKTKAVYVAPLKALCSEKFQEWNKRFQPFGIGCAKVTGDSDLGDIRAINSAHLIITTPEKWDVLTRNNNDFGELLNSIRLFMIDEVHLLNEDVRGPTLEAIVSRMKILQVRFVVASATIPNIQDIALWVGGSNEVTQLVYSDLQRPVPLQRVIIGFNSKLKGFKFDMSLSYKLPEVIRKYSSGKATLVFCNSRKSAEMAAAVIGNNISLLQLSYAQKASLQQVSLGLSDSKLRTFVEHGIAYHHAGLSTNDRILIEDSFRKGWLMIILCTSTLAMGVNLPAYLVIIKSTTSYIGGVLKEYPESSLLQMIGRAGRPQYDTAGVSVILTENKNVRKYEQLMNGIVPIESNLHKHLAVFLNSEIALENITNLTMAMKWMRSTYLYVRAIKNPVHYGLQAEEDRDLIEKYFEKICLVQINELQNAGLITKDFAGEVNLHATAYGRIMAKYYTSFETIKLFKGIRGNESCLELFNLIASCKEFSSFSLRINEKKLLNELNKEIRFPIKGRINKTENKISCLIQAVFGNKQLASPSLAHESSKIISCGERLSKCLLECIRESQNQLSGCYKAILYSVTISKCFHAKLWENSEYVSKQLQKIDAAYSSVLVNAGKTTLKSISETEAPIIEKILKTSSPFGNLVLKNLRSFPEYMVKISLKSLNMIVIHVNQVNSSYMFSGIGAIIIVGDSSNNLLLYEDNVDSILLEHGYFERTINIPDNQVESIYARVVHTSLVGVDAEDTIIVNQAEPKKSNHSTKKARKRQSTLFTCSKKLKHSKNPQIARNLNNTNTASKLKSFSYIKPKSINHKNSIENKSTSDDDHDKSNDNEILSKQENNRIVQNTKPQNDAFKIQSKLTTFFKTPKNTPFESENVKLLSENDKNDTHIADSELTENTIISESWEIKSTCQQIPSIQHVSLGSVDLMSLESVPKPEKELDLSYNDGTLFKNTSIQTTPGGKQHSFSINGSLFPIDSNYSQDKATTFDTALFGMPSNSIPQRNIQGNLKTLAGEGKCSPTLSKVPPNHSVPLDLSITKTKTTAVESTLINPALLKNSERSLYLPNDALFCNKEHVKRFSNAENQVDLSDTKRKAPTFKSKWLDSILGLEQVFASTKSIKSCSKREHSKTFRSFGKHSPRHDQNISKFSNLTEQTNKKASCIEKLLGHPETTKNKHVMQQDNFFNINQESTWPSDISVKSLHSVYENTPISLCKDVNRNKEQKAHQSTFYLEKDMGKYTNYSKKIQESLKTAKSNPYRLKIKSDGNIKSVLNKSTIKELNNIAMHFVLKQKCDLLENSNSLSESSGYESPILTAEQFKLLFE